jgi:hypothetical protein
MRQRTILAALAITVLAMALVAQFSGGGSAATTADQPSKQELARKLLETRECSSRRPPAGS